MQKGHRVFHALNIDLYFVIQDEALKQRLTAQDAFAAFEREEQLIDNAGLVGFNVAYLSSFEELQEQLGRLDNDGHAHRCIVVSDRLTDSNGDHVTPNSLATEFHDWFTKRPQHLGGLVALIDSPSNRVRSINQAVDIRGLTPERLKERICAVANGLWLKSPLTFKGRSDKGVRIHAVHSQSQMKGCLKLRHKVYDAMGYLDPDLASTSDVETDSFDRQAIHFVALEGRRVVGTARLVPS